MKPINIRNKLAEDLQEFFSILLDENVTDIELNVSFNHDMKILRVSKKIYEELNKKEVFSPKYCKRIEKTECNNEYINFRISDSFIYNIKYICACKRFDETELESIDGNDLLASSDKHDAEHQKPDKPSHANNSSFICSILLCLVGAFSGAIVGWENSPSKLEGAAIGVFAGFFLCLGIMVLVDQIEKCCRSDNNEITSFFVSSIFIDTSL